MAFSRRDNRPERHHRYYRHGPLRFLTFGSPVGTAIVFVVLELAFPPGSAIVKAADIHPGENARLLLVRCIVTRILSALAALLSFATLASAAEPWVVYPGGEGPGKGKHVVLVCGDEEYRSEELIPALARILAVHHGFKCTVLFPIDPKDGTINPIVKNNIPGLEALKDADLLVMFLRFRDLPDEQMKHFADYLDSGKPILALRTSTHAFAIPANKTYGKWGWQSKAKGWEGGFGRTVLGETWVNHHGQHGKQATRGILAKGQEKHPVLRGLKDGDVWGPTDVYTVHLPLPGDSQPLLLGQVTTGMKPTDPALEGKKNDPMMPIVWTKTFKGPAGKTTTALTSTMGSAQDFQNEGFRRLLVNGVYWLTGLEAKLPEKAKVDLVGEYKASPFKFGGFVPGKKPEDFRLP